MCGGLVVMVIALLVVMTVMYKKKNKRTPKSSEYKHINANKSCFFFLFFDCNTTYECSVFPAELTSLRTTPAEVGLKTGPKLLKHLPLVDNFVNYYCIRHNISNMQ